MAPDAVAVRATLRSRLRCCEPERRSMPARLAACFVRGELHRAGNGIPPDLMRKRRRPRRPVAAAGPTRANTVNAAVIAGLFLALMRTADIFVNRTAGT